MLLPNSATLIIKMMSLAVVNEDLTALVKF